MIYAVNKRTKEHKLTNLSEYNMNMYPHSQYKIIEADADGWIEWDGGECPLPENALVEVRLRLGVTLYAEAGTFWWATDVEGDGHIIAYRPILDDEPQAPKWDGEGTPPVGTDDGKWVPEVGDECEILIGGFNNWSKCVLLPCDCVAIKPLFSDWRQSVVRGIEGSDKFRPIRTDRERWIEAALKESWVRESNTVWGGALGRIYDAMLNNELPTPGASK